MTTISTLELFHPGPGAAGYLRCYPTDTWWMPAHVDALEQHAWRLGLPGLTMFFDNGLLSSSHLPQFEALIASVADNQFSTVLIPGMWVLSIHDREAQQRYSRLTLLGCHIITLPDRHPCKAAERGAPAAVGYRNGFAASRHS